MLLIKHLRDLLICASFVNYIIICCGILYVCTYIYTHMFVLTALYVYAKYTKIYVIFWCSTNALFQHIEHYFPIITFTLFDIPYSVTVTH